VLNIVLTIPIVLLLIISPLLSPLRIIQLLILFVAIAAPYTAAAVMIAVTPIIYFKILTNNGLKLTGLTRKIIYLSIVWLGYAAFTLLWLNDLPRFMTEYIQLILLLLLTLALVNSINTLDDVKSTNFFLIFSGCLVSVKSFYESLSSDYIEINYYAFISLVTCIAIPISYLNFRNTKSVLLAILFVSIGFLGIVANDSRASTLLGVLLLVVRFFYLLDIRKRIKWIIVSMVLLIAPIAIFWYYNMNDDNILKSVMDVERNYSNLERLALINQSIETYKSNLLGVGYGSTNAVFMSAASYTELNYPHPHNSLAHIAVEIGTVGILIFVYLFYLCIKVILSLNKIKDNLTELNSLYKVSICIVIVLFLFSFLDDMFFNGMFNFYCMMFFAYIYSLSKINQKSTQHVA
jgi:O-antigen ligase